MDDEAELRALRARAYGPHADIAADPVASARLAALEAARRMRSRADGLADERDRDAGAPATAFAGSPGTTAAPEDFEARAGSQLSPGTADADDALPADAAAAQRRDAHRRRIIAGLAWAGSLALVSVVAVSVTSLATARIAATATSVPDDAGVEHVTTLLPNDASEVPEFFGGGPFADDTTVFDDFAGLSVFETGFGWRPPRIESCVIVVRLEDIESATDNAYSGPIQQGCSAGEFPAAAQFTVSEDSPQQLRDRYPEGSGVQFVLRDGVVDVFVSPPSPDSSEATAAAGAPDRPDSD